MAEENYEDRLAFIERTLILLLADRVRFGKSSEKDILYRQDELAQEALSYLVEGRRPDYFSASDSFRQNEVDKISKENQSLKEEVQILVEKINNIELDRKKQNSLSYEYYAMISSSHALRNERFQRVIPVSVYLKDYDFRSGQNIVRSIQDVLETADFELIHSEDPKFGSWYQRIFMRTKGVATLPEVQERLSKIEHAVELAKIEAPQAKIDVDLSKAVLNLQKALKDQDSGIISSGSLFVIKTTKNKKSQLVSLNLTREQMDFVRQNPYIACDPDAFLQAFKTYSYSQQVIKPKHPDGARNMSDTDIPSALPPPADKPTS